MIKPNASLLLVAVLAAPAASHEFLLFEHVHGGNVHAMTMITPDLAFSAEDGGRIRRWERDTTSGNWTFAYMETGYDSRYLLRDVSFGDAQNGWAVGYGGRVLRTNDGGLNWFQPMSSFLTKPGSNDLADLYSVRFVWDSTLGDWRGWVVGFDGVFSTSSDGGSTWQPLAVPPAFTGLDLYGLAVQPQGPGVYRLWVSGDQGTILRSSSNGTTWDAQHALSASNCPAGNLELWDVEMWNGLRGIACGGVGTGCGTAFTTIDGGLSWQPDTCFSSGGLAAPHDQWSTAYNLTLGTSPNVLTCGYASQTNLRTGAPSCWVQTTDPALSYFGHPPTFGVTAMGGRALVSGLFNLVRSSSDGGLTWKTEGGVDYLRERDAAFVNEQVGCVTGQGFQILRTQNGMQSFTRVHVGPDFGPTMQGIAFSPANTQNWLAVGDNHGGYPYVARSANQGLDWARLPASSFPAGVSQLREIAFHPTQPRTALAVGNAGLVLRTTTLGNSFQLLSNGIPAGANLASVAYTSAGDAFVVGSHAGGSAWRLPSGASTWIAVPLKDSTGAIPLTADLNAVATGGGWVWAVGNAGAIFQYVAGEFREVVPASPAYDPLENLVGVAIHQGTTETHVVIGGEKGGVRYTNGTTWTTPRSRLSPTSGKPEDAVRMSAIAVFPMPNVANEFRGYVFGRQFQIARFTSPAASF